MINLVHEVPWIDFSTVFVSFCVSYGFVTQHDDSEQQQKGSSVVRRVSSASSTTSTFAFTAIYPILRAVSRSGSVEGGILALCGSLFYSFDYYYSMVSLVCERSTKSGFQKRDITESRRRREGKRWKVLSSSGESSWWFWAPFEETSSSCSRGN